MPLINGGEPNPVNSSVTACPETVSGAVIVIVSPAQLAISHAPPAPTAAATPDWLHDAMGCDVSAPATESGSAPPIDNATTAPVTQSARWSMSRLSIRYARAVSSTGYSSVVRESAAARDGLFGGLVFVFSLALVRGAIGASTTTGRIVGIAFFGAIVIFGTIFWIRRRRRAPWLEISDDTIELLRPNSSAELQLAKASGNQLRFVSVGSYRSRSLGLAIVGSNTELPLQFFSKKAVKQACIEHNWEFS